MVRDLAGYGDTALRWPLDIGGQSAADPSVRLVGPDKKTELTSHDPGYLSTDGLKQLHKALPTPTPFSEWILLLLRCVHRIP